MLRYIEDVVTLRLNQALCTGCGMCVTVCPRSVYEMVNHKAALADKNACIECGACASNCPVGAITVFTGAGCAAGIIKGALGWGDQCCSTPSGVSPAGGRDEQSCCCGPAAAPQPAEKPKQSACCDGAPRVKQTSEDG